MCPNSERSTPSATAYGPRSHFFFLAALFAFFGTLPSPESAAELREGEEEESLPADLIYSFGSFR